MNPRSSLNLFPKHMSSVLELYYKCPAACMFRRTWSWIKYIWTTFEFRCKIRPHNLFKFRNYFMSSKLQMSKIVIICSYLKKMCELRSEALLTQIFVKSLAAIFFLQWYIFGGINGCNCLLPPKIARVWITAETTVTTKTTLFQRFVDEIFQLEFFVLSANYLTLCIMK